MTIGYTKGGAEWTPEFVNAIDQKAQIMKLKNANPVKQLGFKIKAIVLKIRLAQLKVISASSIIRPPYLQLLQLCQRQLILVLLQNAIAYTS